MDIMELGAIGELVVGVAVIGSLFVDFCANVEPFFPNPETIATGRA